MNRVRLITGGLIAAVTLSVCVAIAQVSADAKKQINTAYAAINAGMAKKDIGAVVKYFTPDYQDIDSGKTTNLATWKSSTEQLFKQSKSIKETYKPTEFKMSGKDVVVTSKVTIDIETIVGPDKKSHKMTGSATSKDTWTQVKTDWKCKKSETLSQKFAIDGTPLTP